MHFNVGSVGVALLLRGEGAGCCLSRGFGAIFNMKVVRR